MNLLLGDCLEKLKELEDNSVDAIVTDPPYGLSFMGKKWDYDVPQVEVWKECLRVLKPGGYLLSFAGTRTQHRMAVNIEDAGFEIRDMIAWVYASGFPKSLNIGKSVNQLETNEWSKIGKALDNIDKKSIMEVWKSNSSNVKIVETQSLKNQIIVGQDTPSENFVVLNVVQNSSQENSNLLVSFVEQNLNEAQAINTKTNTALQSVEVEIKQLQDNVNFAEKQLQNQNHKSWSIFTAQCDVKEWLNENMEVNYRVDEALKTLRGNKKYSNEEITNVLCVVLTNALKLTILNQSKTFQNLGTNQKMECVSAINVIITEYTAENLISNTVAILKSKAVDKLQGNEREVVGKDRSGSERNCMAGDFTGGEYDLTKGTSEWEGWGTALKPAVESITVALKPFNTVPYCDIIEQEVKELLCQLQQLAKTVVESSKSSQVDTKGESDIAQWSAGEYTSTQEGLSVLMGILQLESERTLSLNIVLSWLSILGEVLKLESKSTIEMKISLITELRTLNSLEWGSISQSIIQAKDSQINIQNANVLTVVGLFIGLEKKLRIIQEPFVAENAILREREKAFVPNLSPIIMSRKPLEKGLNVAQNCLKWGVGGINIDGCRVEAQKGDRFGGGGLNSPINGFMGSTDNTYKKGTGFRDDSAKGRFPANLIHDGSEEVVELFPNDSQRFFYTAKASKRERNIGYEGLEEKQTWASQDKRESNSFDVFESDGRPKTVNKNNHPTVKPLALMEYLVKLVSREGQVVLDPFMGSGTTGMACKKLDREFIGIEMMPEYLEIAKCRISAVKKDEQLGLI